MTFDEFVEKCREVDGWEYGWEFKLGRGRIRNKRGECPLQAVSGRLTGYFDWGRSKGLNVHVIADAADGYTNGKYRKALETLVKA